MSLARTFLIVIAAYVLAGAVGTGFCFMLKEGKVVAHYYYSRNSAVVLQKNLLLYFQKIDIVRSNVTILAQLHCRQSAAHMAPARGNTFPIRRIASQTQPMLECHPERERRISVRRERSFALAQDDKAK